MCPMCEDRGWPLGQTAIETRYRELVKHRPTVCAVVKRMMKHLIHNSSNGSWSQQPHVDIPKAKTIAAAQFSKSRSVQAAACQCAQARERGRSARGSMSMPTSGELDRTGQPLHRTSQAIGEDFVLMSPREHHRRRRHHHHHHHAAPRQSLESQMGLNHNVVGTDVNLQQQQRRSRKRSSRRRRVAASSTSSSPLVQQQSKDHHIHRRPASEPHPSARLSGRRIQVALTSKTQTIDTICEACGAKVHIPCLTKQKQLLQAEENLFSSSSPSRSTHWSNPLFVNGGGAGPNNNNNNGDNLSTLSSRLDSFEFRTTSISKRSSASITSFNPRGSLTSIVLSISETVLSTTTTTSSELYQDACMNRSLSRTASLSSLRDQWTAHNEFGCSSCRQRELDVFVAAKNSLARGLEDSDTPSLLHGRGLSVDSDAAAAAATAANDKESDLDDELETLGRFYSSESDTMYSPAAEIMGQDLSASEAAAALELEDSLQLQLSPQSSSSSSPSSSSLAEWVTEYNDTNDKLRDFTKKTNCSCDSRTRSSTSSSSSSSSSTPKSSSNLSSGFPTTGKKNKNNDTGKSTASLKQKSLKSTSIITTSNYHDENNSNSNKSLSSSEIQPQDHNSPFSLSASPSVVVLLGKYGNRKGMRIARLQQSDPQGLKHHHESQQMMMMQRHHHHSFYSSSSNTADSGSSDHSHELSEWACAKRAIASFQDEVARMLLEGTGDASELEDIEDFLNGYMRLNTPFYLEMVEEFFRTICLDCFHKPGLLTNGGGSSSNSSKHTSNVDEPQHQQQPAATATTTTAKSDQHHLSSSVATGGGHGDGGGDVSSKSKWRSTLRIH